MEEIIYTIIICDKITLDIIKRNKNHYIVRNRNNEKYINIDYLMYDTIINIIKLISRLCDDIEIIKN